MRRLVEHLYFGREIQIVTFLSVIFLFLSCGEERNDPIYTRLQQWDTLLSAHPEAVQDSLQTIDPEHLSHAQNAYYGLLKTITDDKTYVDFTSDSLINEVEQYYNIHERARIHHVRSLLYLAIVRYRMGISDSTVMTPLKEAENYFHHQQDQSPEIGYMIHYYLGEVLVRNSQSKSAC